MINKIKNIQIETIDNKNVPIDYYIDSWEEKILNLSTEIKCKREEISESCEINTFWYNDNILENITYGELEQLTTLLLKMFPEGVVGSILFSEFIEKTQFYDSYELLNSDGLLVSDYSICKINGYIIVFSLVLTYELGPYISSIFREDEFEMKKSFDISFTLNDL